MSSFPPEDILNIINDLISSCADLLNDFTNSNILQTFVLRIITSFYYSNMITNFFDNLETAGKEKLLDGGTIENIRREFGYAETNAKLALSDQSSSIMEFDFKIDRSYYQDLKLKITREYEASSQIFFEIEKGLRYKEIEKFLKEKREMVKKCGKSESNQEDLIITTIMESYVSRINTANNNSTLQEISDEVLETYAKSCLNELKNSLDEQLVAKRNQQKKIEQGIYRRWKRPIDLLEVLIDFSLGIAIKKKKELNEKGEFNFKYAALVMIHARSLLISNEILLLLKGGYPDGGYARWRSLYELEVISCFLDMQDEYVSERYLKHEIMREYKRMLNYQKYHSKIGYESYTEEELKQMKKNHDQMIDKYGQEFEYGYGWEWIPDSIIKGRNRNLTKLAEYVGIDHFRPYYDLSSDKVHGGSKGFNHMGLPKDRRDSILLAGPSIYGMADPLHGSAISLQRTTLYLIKQEANPSNIIEMKVMEKIVNDIGQRSLEIHQELEKNGHG